MLDTSTLHPLWQTWLKQEWDTAYFKELCHFLNSRNLQSIKVYPPKSAWFAAFENDPTAIKVVILGQDPYHGEGQAHGLSFSVLPGIKPPPSLNNIYKELATDVPEAQYDQTKGDLRAWANQGVFLLNTVLTVEAGKPASHQNKGWEQLTDTAIRSLSTHGHNIAFILWGKAAQQKANLIDASKHFIHMSPHPSPFSAHTGFFGSKPFSTVNTYLRLKGRPVVDWSLV